MNDKMNDRMFSMKSIAKYLNDRTLTDYIFRLSLLAKSVFKWNNLPNGIDEKHIEKYLYTDGSCLFFEDETKGLMVARCVSTNNVNEYDEPTMVRPTATNYSPNKDYENNIDSYVIRNNDDMIPTSYTTDLYAYKLAKIDRTIDVNIESLQMPIIIKCSDKQKLSLKKVIQQKQDNEPVIWADKGLDLEGVEVLDLKPSIVFDKLAIHKQRVWNEYMTFIGINNSNQDKRERLVADEVDANNEQIEQSAQVMLKARKEACKRINKIFGTNISVELRKLSEEEIEEITGISKDGVIND